MIFLRDVLSGEINKTLRGTGSQLRRPHVPLKLPLLATPAYRGSFFHLWGMDYKALCCRNKNISTNPVFYAIELCRLSRLFFISHILTKPKAVSASSCQRPPTSCYVFKCYSQEIEGWYFQTVNVDFVIWFVLADATERTVWGEAEFAWMASNKRTNHIEIAVCLEVPSFSSP